MSEQPALVSVIMATNRVISFFAEAVDSVARQTHPAVEFIVVDDGAADAPAIDAIVAASAPSAVVLHRRAEGVSAARNAGVAAASGHFVAFLDDDDRWDEDRIALCADALTQNPEAVAAYCGMRVIDDQGRVLIEADQAGGADRCRIARGEVTILPGNLMVTREAFEAVGGFDRGLRHAEDFDLIMKLSASGPFAFVDRALVDYRTHGGNITAQTHDLVRAIQRVRRRHRRIAQRQGDSELVKAFDVGRLRNQRYAWWRTGRAVRELLRARRPLAALREIGWVVMVAPLGPVSALTERIRHRS